MRKAVMKRAAGAFAELDSELDKLDEEKDAAEMQKPNKLKVKLGGFMRLGYRSVLQDDASPILSDKMMALWKALD